MSYTVAVRTLCEFAAKEGDLDLRFTPSPTSQQGMQGHQAVTGRRPAGYQAELPLSGQYKHLTVRGRADGYDPGRKLLEEIKTFKGDLGRQPANHRALHWAQAQVYGALLCAQEGLPSLTVALVYYDVVGRAEAAPLRRECSAAELQAFFESLCERFLHWVDSETAHRRRRDEALAAMRFPHADFRAGQRRLATSVFQAARLGRCLLAQAPTGIGKTLATLFPMLKSCPGEALDKVFFLTAKTPGRALAMQALQTLRGGGGDDRADVPLRTIELVARDKCCEHPGKACHGDACPLARGFYDRLPAARAAALSPASPHLDRPTLRGIALEHAVCPYYLAQEAAKWCDVVVGDYNHFFDGTAFLHGLLQANGWRAGLLVDEAHNLLDRARDMYSVRLDTAQLRALRGAASLPPHLKAPLNRLLRQWRQLAEAQAGDYAELPEPPEPFCDALRELVQAIGAHLADQPASAPQDSALLDFYFQALHFTRLLDSWGGHSMFDVTRPHGGGASDGDFHRPAEGDLFAHPSPAKGPRPPLQATLCIRNVVPAPFLKPRFASVRSAVLFSATLAPADFYGDLLGMPADTAWLDVEAPFDASQLSVHIVRGVSTRYARRDASLAPIAHLIASQYGAVPGNYLAFFSSFDYLERAASVFGALHPDIPMWPQARRLDEAGKAAFLDRFRVDGRGVGFAVLGGAFSEGVDLPGSRLIGAFIATLGLPQVNPVNEAMRRRIDADFGAGHEYVYLYPGLRKVVQAAGRVIRTLSDRGSLHLIDDRFARPEVRRLLPAWWDLPPPAPR